VSKILIVEDDVNLRDLLVLHLEHAGFETLEAETADEAWDGLEQPDNQIDAIILDWMLPGTSGVEWLSQLRQQKRYKFMPVLMLTAKATERDKVEGLGSGADDYLTKPFSTAELVARIHALLRRSQKEVAVSVGKISINEAEGIISFEDKALELTRREYDLLNFLIQNEGRIYSRNDLLDHVWGKDFIGTERTVDQHIAQLRSYIDTDYIETVRARGYRFVNAEDKA